MAEALSGVAPFARAQLQAGVVHVGGAKMAKSTGNLVLVSDLLAGHPAAAVRLLILDRRWGDDWEYEPGGLDAAAGRLEQLQSAAGRPDRMLPGSGGSALAAVRAALADDLDVPAALEIAAEAGGQAARVLGAQLGLW
jgi:cysteinyl-tRNA synthetase